MSEVRLENIGKRFESVWAARNITLTAAQGEFVSLLGGSGCGKTTTLRLIAGFEPPTEGEIFFDGRPMAGVAVNKRNTAMVFQNYALFPHMTVRDNVAFGLKARHLPRHEIGARVAEALQLVEMEGYEQRRPHELSGGQQQRVALARAAAVRPAVLLLDEPLSNLDARLRKSTRAGLKRIQQALGTTAIYVTHDQEEALALSDRIAVMREGRIEQAGSPRDVYERPANTAIARFIGDTNILRGRWRLSDGAAAGVALGDGAAAGEAAGGPIGIFAAAPGAVELFAADGARPVEGAELFAGIKPEAFRLATNGAVHGGASDGAARIEGRILSAEYGGSMTSLHLETAAGAVLARLPDSNGSARFRPGDSIALAFDPASALLFDRDATA